MKSARGPCLLGLIACLGVIGAVLLPYALFDRFAAATYYEFAPVRMETVGVLALLALVLLLGWVFGVVTSPILAGVLSIVGVAMLVNTAVWAWTVPASLVMQFPVDEMFLYHRGALVLFTALVELSGLWFTERIIPA